MDRRKFVKLVGAALVAPFAMPKKSPAVERVWVEKKGLTVKEACKIRDEWARLSDLTRDFAIAYRKAVIRKTDDIILASLNGK